MGEGFDAKNNPPHGCRRAFRPVPAASCRLQQRCLEAAAQGKLHHPAGAHDADDARYASGDEAYNRSVSASSPAAGNDRGNRSRDRTGDNARLTLPDFIYSTYNSLLDSGWRMDEIDRMDMPGFLRVRAWNARREQDKMKPRRRFIDEVWPGVKP